MAVNEVDHLSVAEHDAYAGVVRVHLTDPDVATLRDRTDPRFRALMDQYRKDMENRRRQRGRHPALPATS